MAVVAVAAVVVAAVVVDCVAVEADVALADDAGVAALNLASSSSDVAPSEAGSAAGYHGYHDFLYYLAFGYLGFPSGWGETVPSDHPDGVDVGSCEVGTGSPWDYPAG